MTEPLMQFSLFEPVAWTDGERAVWRQREKIAPSAWAEKYRVVVKSSRPGPWRNTNAPYAAFIMDMHAKPYVRETVLQAAPQTSKTEIMLNLLCWQSERTTADALVVMSGEKTVKRLGQDRLVITWEQSPHLAAQLSNNPDDISVYRIKLKSGRVIYLSWASSPQMLASVPCLDVYFDECNKYPPFAGKEASPIKLGEVRQRTYPRTRKTLKISSPTTMEGEITQALDDCIERYDLEVACPFCGEYQQMVWENFHWPEEVDYKTIAQEKLGRYICQSCGTAWKDSDRDRAVRNFRMVPRHGIKNPTSVGFQVSSWYSQMVSLSEVVADRLEFEAENDHAKEMAWYNNHAALPWEPSEGEKLEVDDLIQRVRAVAWAGPRYMEAEEERMVIPAAAGVLTAGVDVQKDRLELEMVAWGLERQSWSMDYRVLYGDPTVGDVWRELDDYLLIPWRHDLGIRLSIACCCVDSGYLNNEVLTFVKPRWHRRVYGTKGMSQPGKPLVGKPTIQGKLKVKVFPIGVDTAKDTMFGHLAVPQPGPGFCQFPADRPADYFRQFETEKQITRWVRGQPYRRWEKTKSDARNEAIDLRVLNMVALSILNPHMVKILQRLQQRAEREGMDAPLRPPVAADSRLPAASPVKEHIKKRRPAAVARPKKSWATGWRR